jgi:hypothetical protein
MLSVFKLSKEDVTPIVTHKPLYLVVCILVGGVPTMWCLTVKTSINNVRKRKNTKTRIPDAKLLCFTHILNEDVVLSRKGGSLPLITTKGGHTEGRIKQTYIHLLAEQTYTITAPTNCIIMWHDIWDVVPANVITLHESIPELEEVKQVPVSVKVKSCKRKNSVDTEYNSKKQRSLKHTQLPDTSQVDSFLGL